ncbi:Isonitrile hydratase [Bordetella sputigena]|uniref:DJ-1/PfpI family protein n=1 Tax=Bordetella sputigena TaxID=1416810 RepID=UPI0039EE49DC
MELSFLLYPGVEPIDLAAVGAISMAKRVIPEVSYQTLSLREGPVVLANGLTVCPDRSVADVRQPDVLLVPGGPGWRAAAADAEMLSFIRRIHGTCTLASACTGAMILAAAGVLDGRRATTKVQVVPPEQAPLDELSAAHPAIVPEHALLVDEGDVITGGGVTLCIDLVLYLLARRYGAPAAAEVARIMEYDAAHVANRSRLPIVCSKV